MPLTARPGGRDHEDTSTTEEVTMDEVLTIEEIETRFAPEWVLIGEPQTDENLSVQAGQVLFHSPDRGEVYRQARDLRPGRFAVLYLGPCPEDMPSFYDDLKDRLHRRE